jgi:hypothetical protein
MKIILKVVEEVEVTIQVKEGSSTNDDGYGDFTDNSQYNGFRFFFIEDNRKLFESDSLSSFKNLLYTEPSGNSNGKIKFLFTDEVNQELYYLESPAEWRSSYNGKKDIFS